MDVKVSRKEPRLQPTGPVWVLVDNIFDLYPVFGDDSRYVAENLFPGQNNVTEEEKALLIVDVEILDDEREELLDRAMTALVKQRGADPVEPDDGIQWAESIIGEVSSAIILQQVKTAVAEEGPGVRATPYAVKAGNQDRMFWSINLTNAV